MELDQFYIDVKTDCSYLEKKSNVLRWSLFKNDISARSENYFKWRWPLSIRYSLINLCKHVLCQRIYSSIWWMINNYLLGGFLCHSLTLALFFFFWLLNEFHFVTIYWLVCRDRNSALCHIRVSLTSCIGAGHIIFFAGIDSTGNQVTLWTPIFVLLSWCCCSSDLLVYLFVCLFF